MVSTCARQQGGGYMRMQDGDAVILNPFPEYIRNPFLYSMIVSFYIFVRELERFEVSAIFDTIEALEAMRSYRSDN